MIYICLDGCLFEGVLKIYISKHPFFLKTEMTIEEQKIKFINSSMNAIYDLCDELYEVLVDEDYGRVDYLTKDILEVLKDLNQTFHDEI